MSNPIVTVGKRYRTNRDRAESGRRKHQFELQKKEIGKREVAIQYMFFDRTERLLRLPMDEKTIEEFWEANPCGQELISEKADRIRRFFDAYDEFRYDLESHIPDCLDSIDWSNKAVLEIGLGQGADSEQIARRGAKWCGVDLTQTAVERTRARFLLKNLPNIGLVRASATKLPFKDNSFDIVYSHGVLHHIPQIKLAQKEISRVLKPSGELVIMVYAKNSANYFLSISIVRRIGLLFLYLFGIRLGGIYDQHVTLAKELGIFRYLKMKNFIHRSTDGPYNPYSKVYDLKEVRKDFEDFRITSAYRRFMHAPPIPVHGLSSGRMFGWHLWVHLRPRT